jgi:hypothetical protein
MVTDFKPELVLVVTLPPGGVTHARYMLTRLRQRFPDVKLLLGRWGAQAEEDARGQAIKGIDGHRPHAGGQPQAARGTARHPAVGRGRFRSPPGPAGAGWHAGA